MSATPKPKPITYPRSAEYLRRQLEKKQREIEGLRLHVRMLRRRPQELELQQLKDELTAEKRRVFHMQKLIDALNRLDYMPRQNPMVLQAIRHHLKCLES